MMEAITYGASPAAVTLAKLVGDDQKLKRKIGGIFTDACQAIDMIRGMKADTRPAVIMQRRLMRMANDHFDANVEAMDMSPQVKSYTRCVVQAAFKTAERGM